MPSPWTIEFYDAADGDDMGSISYDGQTMTPHGGMAQEIVDGAEPEDVFERYHSWSNGYVSSRLQGEKRPMPHGGVRLSSMEDRHKAMTNYLETNRFVDVQAGEDYDPPGVPPDPEEDDGSTPSTPPGS
jgi:hypothetical protein